MKSKSVILFMLISFLFVNQFVNASPAYPGLIEFVQPDGTKLNIYLKGDERNKMAKTQDGYTLLFNKNGFYEYAVLDNSGDLIPSGLIAKNSNERNLTALSLLSKTQKALSFSNSQISVLEQIDAIYKQENAVAQAFPTTGSRKLICLLIGYTDKPFTKTNADFTNLFNQVGYNIDGATGSVKDFYLQNSYGQLDLAVDIAGPYVASQNMAYYGANDARGYDVRPRELLTEAINKADAEVNFANYDNDGDGWVDGVYMIYAGYGEEAGGGADAIWAHAWGLSSAMYKDGVYLQRYSCSSELRGNSGSGLCRIGVICHEFGHVLGAPDFYDTNYSTNGQYEGTGNWDLMAGGSWNNNGATPAHHTGFTKVHYLNWASETVLSTNATITLNNAEQNSNSFYRLNTTTANEYFFIENREKHLFDSYIPGSGMIIYHVHKDISTGSINITHPQKMYPVSQNATSEPNSTPASYGNINSETCAWTGIDKNAFSDVSVPSSKSWAGANTGKPISQISRNATNKTVTFTIGGAVAPPAAPLAAAATNTAQSGFTANWNSSAGATGYFLDVSTSSTFGSFVTGYNNKSVGNVTTSSVSGLAANTTYYYRLRASNSGGTSGNSNTITVKTLQVTIPAAPVATPASNIARTSFSANWNSSAGATGYYLDVSTVSSFISFVSGFNNKNVGNLLTSKVTGLKAGKIYYYRVRAYNTAGASPNSNTVNCTTSTVKSGEIDLTASSDQTEGFLIYPNPFKNSLTINYSIATTNKTSLKIFDINGKLVKTLYNADQEPGSYQFIWDATNDNNAKVKSGVFICKLQSGDYFEVRKLIYQ